MTASASGKVLFVGPTLPDAARLAPDLDIRAPAIQGDLYRAVRQGAGVIGLIDGGFEYTAPVWHKEILHALSEGVAVFGASSMGALRAAECAPFGMIGIGSIANDYIASVLTDDSDVAQLHAPQELGWASLTEPLVNVMATLRQPHLVSRLSPDMCRTLETAACGLFFKDRTWKAIIRRACPGDAALRERLQQDIADALVNRKREDALLLIDALNAHSGSRTARPTDWVFQETTLWHDMIGHQTPPS